MDVKNASVIRPIQREDNPKVAAIIRAVMTEFGASGKGFAIHDAEVDDMYHTYTQPRSSYFVCELDGGVVGGGGVAPLQNGDFNTCELKKMYFLPAGRGKGLGQLVLTTCLQEARKIGFEICYLETFNTMKAAMKLYEKNGFKKIPGPCGSTGHFSCDTFYQITL
jgi:putative acetyltransferase